VREDESGESEDGEMLNVKNWFI